MGKTYYLDLKTVIEILEGQSGVLQRELPKEVSTLNEVCLCVIDVTKGAITRCLLITKSGQQFDGYGLLPSLSTVENWDVTLTPDQRATSRVSTSPSLPSVSVSGQLEQQREATLPPPSEEHLVPFLVVPIGTVQLAHLTHKERILVKSVLSQINGVRSVAEIRARLPLSRAVINQILDFLTRQSIIRFQS